MNSVHVRRIQALYMYLFLSATETKDKCPLNHDQIKTWQPWPRYLEEQGKPIFHMETMDKEGDSE